MTTPKVYLRKEPFPHAIIEDFYNEEELKLIWKELDYLTSPNKMILSGEELGTAKDNFTQVTKSSSYGIMLDEYFSQKKYSDILVVTDKIFNLNLLNQIASLHPLMGHVSHLNDSTTKLKYYEDAEEYKAHIDTSRFTMTNYFFKNPKQFTGGDLYFKDFDYTIEIKNNMVVFFCGAINHASTKLISNDFYDKFSGYGKYCVTKLLGIKEC
jgi:Rps23 Pro-64 3,4-dihydroxylase Tpa1-like proline 4-hydroxylase